MQQTTTMTITKFKNADAKNTTYAFSTHQNYVITSLRRSLNCDESAAAASHRRSFIVAHCWTQVVTDANSFQLHNRPRLGILIGITLRTFIFIMT